MASQLPTYITLHFDSNRSKNKNIGLSHDPSPAYFMLTADKLQAALYTIIKLRRLQARM
jgi:hypothetical protein